MFGLVDAVLLIVFIFAALYWVSAQKIKQTAFAAVKKYCQQMEVQFLDESIVLRAIWFKKDKRNNIRLWRSYVFEFSSTGDDRYRGRVVILGNDVESLELEPHRLH